MTRTDELLSRLERMRAVLYRITNGRVVRGFSSWLSYAEEALRASCVALPRIWVWHSLPRRVTRVLGIETDPDALKYRFTWF